MTRASIDGSLIRVVVVDDHPIVREGLIAILMTQPDLVIAGEAGTGPDAVAVIDALRPDVVLLDLELPGLDGVRVIEHVRADCPQVRIIVFTAFDTDDRILAALRAGALGYLLKGAPRDEIFRAIRVAHAGGSLIEPVVASKLLRHLSAPSSGGPTGFRDGAEDTLTPRESDVLRLLARGLQNKEIAAELSISERTVKFHVGALLRKLGAGNRTEVVAIAAQRGLVSLGQ